MIVSCDVSSREDGLRERIRARDRRCVLDKGSG